jgi:TatA/E family protein of Tat protein translocase
MIYGLGPTELIVILAIAMLLFGGKKLPEVGRNLGQAIRGFKQAEDEATQEIQEAARNAKTAETADPGEAAGSDAAQDDSTEASPGEKPEGEPSDTEEPAEKQA